ncbi:MAG: cupin domain-containing protein [Rhodobiaceae bacterium]|nr:cupin domain-containing protein [Rhodobiaceae bacterium]MCC0053129.1 cupin domain-containing protein [Rhodobiaceae bacterium]
MQEREPAFERLLALLSDRLSPHGTDSARALQEALKAPRFGTPTGKAASVPGCAFLPEALDGADDMLRAAMAGISEELSWRVPGFGRLPDELGARMAAVVLVGPGGMIHHDEVSLGLILLGPRLQYPSHSHAAEELYLVLSGTLQWQIDGQPIGTVRAGQFVHHRPWQGHAMSTGPRPALLFWGWLGDIRGETYSMQD